MFALIFVAMWAHTSGVHAPPIMQMHDLDTCRALGVMLEAQSAERYAGHPDGQPTAIHWWCVETDESGVI